MTNQLFERRALLKVGAALPFAMLLPHTASAQVVNMNDAINKAGRQRMLSQRMAKAWLAVGQGIEAKKADKILSESMALFDRQLTELKAYAPSPDIKTTYSTLDSVWSDYKSALVGKAPDRATAQQVLALEGRVLKLAHQGTVQLEQLSGRSVGKLVNMAGRQRMLSQRSAKCYLSKVWGVAAPDQLKELDVARKEFVDALQTLKNAPETTPAIKGQLEMAQQQWIFFDNALSRAGDTANASLHSSEVFASSENILQVMDLVTGLYSKLT